MAAVFNEELQCIECRQCGVQIPLHRSTLRNGDKFTETMEMAREVHEDCVGTTYEASLSRRWKEITIFARSQGTDIASRVAMNRS